MSCVWISWRSSIVSWLLSCVLFRSDVGFKSVWSSGFRLAWTSFFHKEGLAGWLESSVLFLINVLLCRLSIVWQRSVYQVVWFWLFFLRASFLSLNGMLPYSPENKPPPLFDLQILAQVFLILPRLLAPAPMLQKCIISKKWTPGDRQESCYSESEWLNLICQLFLLNIRAKA